MRLAIVSKRREVGVSKAAQKNRIREQMLGLLAQFQSPLLYPVFNEYGRESESTNFEHLKNFHSIRYHLIKKENGKMNTQIF